MAWSDMCTPSTSHSKSSMDGWTSGPFTESSMVMTRTQDFRDLISSPSSSWRHLAPHLPQKYSSHQVIRYSRVLCSQPLVLKMFQFACSNYIFTEPEKMREVTERKTQQSSGHSANLASSSWSLNFIQKGMAPSGYFIKVPIQGTLQL